VIEPVDYLAVGHITRDILPDASYVVGGTVSYAALTAAAFRRTVGILTSARSDMDLSTFKDRVCVTCWPSERTTTFQNRYIEGYRQQIVYGVADSLTPAQVPSEWAAPRIVHIGPVIGECQPTLIDRFSTDTFVGITPQGWMRSTNGDGHVHRHIWRSAEALLPRASAVVFSIDDVEGDWGQIRAFAALAQLLVVTMGREGGMLYVNGEAIHFPALAVPEVDPTGAGDIFAAVFFHAMLSEADPRDAARFAACVASRSVSRGGLQGVPGAKDIALCCERIGVCF
jgi:sugar/nucleoside kinase (ribokinase family)